MFVPSRGRPPEPPEGYIRDPGNPFMFRPMTTITNQEDTLQELYQHLYEDPMLNYGRASMRRCPGVKFYPEYKDWLVPPVFDFGCGRGDTVRHLQAEGYKAWGMDQIDLRAEGSDMLIGDITKPFELTEVYNTALCIDVFEHILDADLRGLMQNMAQCKRQVISVHTGPAFERGCKTDLHINKKSFQGWREFLSQVFEVKEFRQLGKRRGLFLCLTR